MRRIPAIAYTVPQVPAGSGGELGQPQVFVQDTEPSASYPYVWVVTDAVGNPTGEIRSHYGGAIGPVDVDAIQALADTKGDLLVALGADLLTRLAVGANGRVLTADSTAPAGVSWQPSSLRANAPIPGVVAPGNTPEVASYSAPGANSMRGQRIIIPAWATHVGRLWVPIGTASGNVRGAVYDVGATTNAIRTRLLDGASTPAVAGWTLLGDANLTVTGLQHLDVTAIADNATVTFGRRTLGGGSEQALPTAVAMVAGCQYKVAWSNAAGSFTNPATLNEGNAATGVSGLIPIIVEVS